MILYLSLKQWTALQPYLSIRPISIEQFDSKTGYKKVRLVFPEIHKDLEP